MISLSNFESHYHEFHARWNSLKLKYVELYRVKLCQAPLRGFIIVLNVVVVPGRVILVPHLKHLIDPSNNPFVYLISLDPSRFIPRVVDWVKSRSVRRITSSTNLLMCDHIFQMLDDPLNLYFSVNLRKLTLLYTLIHQKTSRPYLL